MVVHNAQEKIVEEVSKWSGVTASPHRFGGTEFRLGRIEIGHVHGDHQVDIPFSMKVRNRLVSENRAEPHHIFPKTSWITFRIRKEQDIAHAIELFKLSYNIMKEKTLTQELTLEKPVR